MAIPDVDDLKFGKKPCLKMPRTIPVPEENCDLSIRAPVSQIGIKFRALKLILLKLS